MMAKDKKPVAGKEEVMHEPESADERVRDNRPRWGLGSIFWGLLLITVGVLALLSNFGLVSLNLAALTQLWPLLLVVWGVSMLSIRGPVWRSMMIVLVILTLGFITWVAVSGANLGLDSQRSARSETQTVGQLSAGATQLQLSVEAGASKVKLDSEDMKDTLRATLNSNVATLDQTSELRGDTQHVRLTLESDNRWWFSGVKNELNVDLSRNVPTVLYMKVGAADLRADLRNVMLDKLTLNLGASSADITLGELRDDVSVVVDSGASSLNLHIPQSVGVRVDLEDGATSKEFEGLENKGDGVYESSNYASATKKLAITGDAGATSFKIDRY